MTALLTNRSFQMFVIVLAAIGALCALLATGTVDKTTGQSLLTAVIGFGFGLPVSTIPGETPPTVKTSPTTAQPAPVASPPPPAPAPTPAVPPGA